MPFFVGGLTVFRLPRSHWHAALWNFEWDKVHPPSLKDRVTAFLLAVQDSKAPHLLLTGDPGAGKTHIGVGVYRVATTVWGTAMVSWINVPAFCERVKRSYGDNAADPWEDIESARRLVVLDDLFGKELTNHEKDQVITRLLDTIYQNGAALLATMNPPAEELKSRLPPHEVSRLLADSTIIPMRALKDWRRG